MIILILRKLGKDWEQSKREIFDFKGSIIYVPAIIAIIYGFSTISEVSGKFLLLGGILELLVFIIYERGSKNPLINIKFFKNNVFTFSSLSMLIINITTSGMWPLLSLYLQYLKSLTPQFAGIILVTQPLVVSVLSPFVGRLSDKVETIILAPIGMVITVFGLFLLIFLNETTSLEFIILALILIGVGVALFSSPTTNAFMGSVGKKVYGVASATFSTMIYSGQVLSFGLVILIFSIYLGTVQITPQNYPVFLKSLSTAFLVFSAICFVGIFVSIASSKK